MQFVSCDASQRHKERKKKKTALENTYCGTGTRSLRSVTVGRGRSERAHRKQPTLLRAFRYYLVTHCKPRDITYLQEYLFDELFSQTIITSHQLITAGKHDDSTFLL